MSALPDERVPRTSMEVGWMAKHLFVGVAALVLSAGCAEPEEEDTAETTGETSQALQHGGANAHQWWRLPAIGWNVDQRVLPQEVSNSTYFALVFGFENNDRGGYMGLQQQGDGTRNARFSIWNSTSATPGAGASCRDFGGEGVGKTCELPLKWIVGRWYKYRVWELSRSWGYTTWGAWIIDEATGAEYHIGNIRAPYGSGRIDVADSFDEYFGTATSCYAVPRSSVFFLSPYVNQSAYSQYGSTSTGSCSGGRVTQGYGGTQLQLGYAK
jgi:hypothetical protein